MTTAIAPSRATTGRADSIRQIAASQTARAKQYRSHVSAVELMIFERSCLGQTADADATTAALCASSALLGMEALRHERNAASSTELAALIERGVA